MFRDITGFFQPGGPSREPNHMLPNLSLCLYQIHLDSTLHPLQGNAVSLLQPGRDGWLKPTVETIQGQDFMAGENRGLACGRHGLASGLSPCQLTFFPPPCLKPTFKPLVAHLSEGTEPSWQSSFRLT